MTDDLALTSAPDDARRPLLCGSRAERVWLAAVRAALRAVGVAVLLIGAWACGSGGDVSADTDAPATTVTQSGDTTIIVPVLDGPTGRLVSDLVIGADESIQEAVFGRVFDAAFGPEGEIIVVDYQASLVSVFSQDGKFLRVLARGGEGPGEIDWPKRVRLAADGRIAIASFREVEVFDAQGQPSVTFRPQERIQDPIRFDADGLLRMHTGLAAAGRHAPWTFPGGGIANVAVVTGPASTSQLLLKAFDDRGEEVESEPAPFGMDDLGCFAPDPDRSSGFVCVGLAYQAFPVGDWLPDGRFIQGHASRYQLDYPAIGGTSGHVSLRPNRPPIRVGGAFSDFIAGGRIYTEPFPLFGDSSPAVPTVKPAMADLLPTRDNTLWVRLHAPSERRTDDEGEETWVETESRFDIFILEGEHVGYVTGPADLTVRDVRGDTVLATRTGQFGVSIVERFVIDWSDPN